VQGQSQSLGGLAQARGRAPARFHFQLGDGAIWILADGMNVQTKEQIAHRRISSDHHFVNGTGLDGKFLNRMPM